MSTNWRMDNLCRVNMTECYAAAKMAELELDRRVCNTTLKTKEQIAEESFMVMPCIKFENMPTTPSVVEGHVNLLWKYKRMHGRLNMKFRMLVF